LIGSTQQSTQGSICTGVNTNTHSSHKNKTQGSSCTNVILILSET
jgi:hypothetical protein